MQRDPLSTARNQMNSRENNRLSKRSHHANNNNNPSLAVQATVPALTPAQMYSNFEEWIKMCTDNKVNATNTWNFALIDYFHEMTFIREGDSINFQKASCTLDGCVKIYTSRVDSVATETGKLLSGLADSTNGDGDDENKSEKRVRRKTNRSEATLLKDFSSIALKKFDLDFAVDPLFKKTSADFDEGGARGLLLNHLGIDRYCKIIFDASDATVDCDLDELDDQSITIDPIELPQELESEEDASTSDTSESEDDPMEEDDQPGALGSQEDESNEKVVPEITSETVLGEKQEDVPIAEVLIKKDVPNEAPRVEIFRLKSKLRDFQSLSDHHIVPFLKGFDFFTDNDDDLAFPDLDLDQEMENDIPVAPIENEDEGFQFDDYDVDFGGDDEDVDPFQFDNNDQPFDNDSPQEFGQEPEEENDFPENDFLSALIHNNQGDNDMFNYFDSTLVKNWAGPEHWKLRRPVKQKINDHASGNTDGQEEEPTTQTATRKRTKVAEFLLPFDQEENEDAPPTFEVATRKPLLSKDLLSKMSDNLLPDDIHFSSKLLLQYSLKPAFLHNHKKKKVPRKSSENNQRGDTTQAENDGINADVDFWADQTTQDFGGGVDDDMMMDDFGDDVPTSNFDDDTGLDQTMLTAFEDTSYYHDTYDDPETSVLYGDELITNHRLKKTKPLYVKYARTAKRVDVKKLKDNLWKALTIKSLEADAKVEAHADAEEEKVCGVQKFTNIVNSLKKMYSSKTMRDISVPFCFIVLLHLANEKDLSIKGLGPDMDEDDFVLGEGDWMANEDILNEVTITQN